MTARTPAGARPVDVDAIRARAEAATPGPWTVGSPYYQWEVCISTDLPLVELCNTPAGRADAAFIAAARDDVPALLAEVERLRTRIAAHAEPHRRLLAEVDALRAEVLRLCEALGAGRYHLTDAGRAALDTTGGGHE